MSIFKDDIELIKFEREKEKKDETQKKDELRLLFDTLGSKLNDMVEPLAEVGYESKVDYVNNLSYIISVANKGSLKYVLNGMHNDIGVFIGKGASMGIPTKRLHVGDVHKSKENDKVTFHVDSIIKNHFYEFVKYLDKQD
ncbi:hypothetical protein [Macrococcus equi]|uniref:hypothetical protein n=1 Tax=Macrococcus equi TaxID=3395462 RepID=UPI0039BE4FAA